MDAEAMSASAASFYCSDTVEIISAGRGDVYRLILGQPVLIGKM